MNCQPIDSLPPPPPEFGADGSFSLADLPPPMPLSQPPTQSSQPPWEKSPQPHQTCPPWEKPSQLAQNCPPWEQNSPATTNSKGNAPPPTLAKKGKLNTNFLSKLNSTLGGPESGTPTAPPTETRQTPKAVENLKNQRSTDSPPRGNLLSQIQNGCQLKKTENIQDRSAPKL